MKNKQKYTRKANRDLATLKHRAGELIANVRVEAYNVYKKMKRDKFFTAIMGLCATVCVLSLALIFATW